MANTAQTAPTAQTRIDKLLSQLNEVDDDENEHAKIDHIIYFVKDLEYQLLNLQNY